MFLVQPIKDRKIYISNVDIPTPGTDSCQDPIRSYNSLRVQGLPKIFANSS